MNVTRNNNPSVIVVYFVYTSSVTVEYSQSRPLSDVLYYNKEKNRQAKNGGTEGGSWCEIESHEEVGMRENLTRKLV